MLNCQYTVSKHMHVCGRPLTKYFTFFQHRLCFQTKLFIPVPSLKLWSICYIVKKVQVDFICFYKPLII